MPPKPTKGAMEDSPPESPTAALLECLVGRAQKQDDTLALLTELLLKQQKQSMVKDRYNPRGLPLPKASDIPCFQGPLGDADSVLTHLRRLQQLLRTNGLLTPSDDEELEARRRITVIELANNLIDCAGLVGWVKHEGHHMEEDGRSTWQDWSVAFKAKAMPSHWEYQELRTLFHLSLQEISPNAWRKFDDAVILHRSHLHRTHHYPLDHEIACLYHAACPECLFLRLVDEPRFHMNDLDGLHVLISNHIERIMHEDAASQHAPHSIKTPTSSASRSSDSAQLPQPVNYYHDPTHPLPYYHSPAGWYIHDVFHQESCCFDCCKLGHQHPQCPSHMHHNQPKVNQLETELTVGDTTLAYLTLVQTILSAAEPIQDSSSSH
ncbi:hypothetical protein C366_06171 [Cryptococcus neoformans Tu401-1]|nr:hypothetical protein C366_06171 [Cryptococcus neoformans var. grubii Tu401-1]